MNSLATSVPIVTIALGVALWIMAYAVGSYRKAIAVMIAGMIAIGCFMALIYWSVSTLFPQTILK